ncbi:MAG: type II secretion system protein GspC [Myxococcota bacterium]
MNRSVAIGVALLSMLTFLAAGSAFAMNLAIGRWVAPDGPAPDAPEGEVVATSRPSTPPSPRALTVEAYLDGIMGRNLFDMEIIGTWNPPAPGLGVATTQLKIKLIGTAVADPAEYSSAMIADETNPAMPTSYGIGDSIQDREIVSIEADRVGLKSPDGTIEYLTMNDGEIVSAASSGGEETPSGEGVSSLGENKFAVSKDLFDKYISDPEGIAGLGRALLHRGPDGEYDGYRLSAIRRNTLADQLGIKNGDIIHAVNGQPLNSVQSAMSAYGTMRSESSFCFEISRRGSPQQLCYEVR